ncbi:probable transcriptional regulator SLK2 isoform X2 [Elaeis guineensis]|uniref:Probable transcriptional regulator SLK2 isoform X2 n=1 Tax=Elaeis guineensis var. tenera TaxID=51953 RepID=A0A8N4F248_ELAGV|nr:probable transcriptional regulator SLK2 isoform X2 [Elaeis guineensis]
MSGTGRSGLGLASGDMNHGVLNSAANSSGPSVGASSLVTDASSALSGKPQLQRSASINTESYIRLPASPMSFTSNNISGSSMMDGSSIVQQSPHHDQVQNQVVSSAMSQPTAQEVGDSLNAQKKPRLDMRHGSNYQQPVIQKRMQTHEPLQLQGHQNPELQAMIQQQRLAQRQAQQQQLLQSFPQIQQAQTAHQQQHQVRQHQQQQTMQPVTLAKCPTDGGICARRLMQYMYHKRNRPADNSIHYWKKFVMEYFAPRAKKRWCLSLYDNIKSNHDGAWQCSICGSRSGKGFEATFEILPRLSHIKIDSGVIDELLFLSMPHERQLPSGIMVLDYAKVAQEGVYEHLRVVHEGQLRIIFTAELKILSWEFCIRHHNEFLPRRVLAPQVSQLLHAAHKYQTAVADNGSAGVLHQDFQATCNILVQTTCQVAKKLELPSLNDLGFSKKYVRYLQMSEVVNSMKDLIDFSQEHKIGPLESFKNYPQQVAAKLQNPKIQEPEQPMTAHGLPADQSSLSKIIGIHPGRSSNMNNAIAASRVHNNIPQSSVAGNNYQNLLRNHVNTSQNEFLREASSTINAPNHAKPGQFQGSVSSLLTNMSVNGLAGGHQQHVLSGTLHQQNNLQPSQVNQNLEQHVIQQLLQEVFNNRGTPQQAVGGPNANGNMLTGEGFGSGITGTGVLPARMNVGSVKNGTELGNIPANMSSNALGPLPSRSNSFNSVARNPAISGNSQNSRPDLPQSIDLPELDQIAQEFAETGIFNGYIKQVKNLNMKCWVDRRMEW